MQLDDSGLDIIFRKARAVFCRNGVQPVSSAAFERIT